MAGDWIKMRGNLWDDPRVSRLCDLTDQPEAMVIGALYWLWSSADSHTEDGLMPGLSLKGIDRKSGVPGFGKALLDVGWIAEVEGGIAIVRFDEHNGKSAKRRSMEAKRKGEVRKVSASDADKSKTESGKGAELELEKELEKEKDKKNPPVSPQGGLAGFDEFWSAYPKKTGKGAAERAWKKIKPGKSLADQIVKSVGRHRLSDQWQREAGRYIPNPATWLNEKRWEDEVDVNPGKPPVCADPMAKLRSEYQELHSRIKADERLGIQPSNKVTARLSELLQQLNPSNGGLQ